MNRQKIRLSILCTAYNHENYIRQALEGFVCQQTDFPFEAIVHDDASTDGTADIIREYAEKYPHIIKPILQTQNQYSRHADLYRDILEPAAQGEYFACCEGDDYWTDPLKLQKQVAFLDRHPEYAGAAHNCIFVDGDGKETENIYSVYRNCRAHRFTLKRFSRDVVYPGQTASLVYRRSACAFASARQEADFYAMRAPTWDKRTILKLLLAGDIYCFGEAMSAYRIVTRGGHSWSAANRDKNRSFLLHAASIDFRRYVRKHGNRPFANYYTTFHTGMAGILKYLLRPDPQNKAVCRRILQEHGGIGRTLLYLAGLGVISIPLFFLRELERIRYDAKS